MEATESKEAEPPQTNHLQYLPSQPRQAQRIFPESVPRIHLNMAKIHQKGSPKAPKSELFRGLEPPWSPNSQGCENTTPNGDPRASFREPMGTYKNTKTVKNVPKPCPEWSFLKVNVKVTKQDSPEPQKVGFRTRGVQIFMVPTNLQKVIQTCPKRL